MTRPDLAIDAYLEGTLTADHARSLEAWINTSADNAASFLHLVRTHQTLGIIGKEKQIARKARQVTPGQLDAVTLASLAEMEANAEPIPFDTLDQPFSFETKARIDRNRQDTSVLAALDDLRWAAGKFAGRLIRSPYGITGAIAAVLVLGLVLFAPWQDAPHLADNTNPNANKPAASTPRGSIPSNQPVATLTATNNATWAEGALAPGSQLRAGTRLTLTQGFAEITTHAGAIAILQAPATIELLDSTNALRLHAGKLVGICETDASKGFLVHTPHLDITDLGTRFGVDAKANTTEVHVFEGKVQAERVDAQADAQPIVLVANKSARTSVDTDVITSIDHDAERYAQLLPTTIELPGTGHGLKVGDIDPNWQIVAVDGKPLEETWSLSVSGSKSYVSLVPNDPQRSQWVAWDPQIKQDHVCTLRTRITIPDEIDADTARIDLRYYADAQVRAIVVNGQRKVLDVGPPVFGYWPEDIAQITEHLQSGVNEIELDIANLEPGPGLGTGLVGLKLEWQLIGEADWKQAQ